MVMEQLPLAGIVAPVMDTALAELVNVPDAPAQVVVGAGDVCIAKLPGTVSVKLDWVKSKALALLNVMVSVEATFSATLAGENASVTAGGVSVTVSGVGHAVAAVPAEVGAKLLALFDVTVMVAVSASPAESVMVNVSVSVPAPGVIVTWGVFFAEPKVMPLVADHA
jgi:hypothetical protein